MKTLKDIEKLAGIHPVIDLGLNAIKSGAVSVEDGLMEMVCHLAENLALFKEKALSYDTPREEIFPEPATEKIEVPAIEVEHDQLRLIKPMEADPVINPLQDRLQPHRLPNLDQEVKKKRGWPW